MTPDEDPFIAALAADPADETTRLVYADWLEERGDDARAAYLRAELAHFRMSAQDRRDDEWADMPGVDRVWANMIARPPFGITVPGLTFGDTGSKATRAELKALESHWGRPPPADYAAFMLLYNGGSPSKPYLWSSDQGEDFFDAVSFFSTRDKDASGRVLMSLTAADLLGGHCLDVEEAKAISRMMPIATLTYSYDDGELGKTLLALVLDPSEIPFADVVVEIDNHERRGLRQTEAGHAKETFRDLLLALVDGP
jgi:uncharacterized protein (TIGR02996 family)